MAAEATRTWDIDPARRPSLDDVGGAQLVDKAGKEPPQDGTHPYANMLNQGQHQQHAAALMIPSVRLTIDFSAGAPFVLTMMSPSTTLLSSDFTLTDNATGDTTITWTAGKLPTMQCDPIGSVNADTTSACSFTARRVTATSIRVRVLVAGALSDSRFTVEIY